MGAAKVHRTMEVDRLLLEQIAGGFRGGFEGCGEQLVHLSPEAVRLCLLFGGKALATHRF